MATCQRLYHDIQWLSKPDILEFVWRKKSKFKQNCARKHATEKSPGAIRPFANVSHCAPRVNSVQAFRNLLQRCRFHFVESSNITLRNTVRRIEGIREQTHVFTHRNTRNISSVDVTQPYNPRLRQLHFCPQCTSIRIIYGGAILSDSHRARAIWHARPFSWMGTARGPSGGRMNEIVNIIDRRAGVGRPVRTGKQKQAERGARRERRGVLYAAGVGSRSSPFYHPKSLDSIFFFFLPLFRFFFRISRVSTCFQIHHWYSSSVGCFHQPLVTEELFM